MSKLIVLCLLVLCVSASLIDVDAASTGSCLKPNQEWFDSCAPCIRRCENPEVPICTMQCVFGCQCKRGYFVNNAGECVTLQECYSNTQIS